jgi:hypothetical protein
MSRSACLVRALAISIALVAACGGKNGNTVDATSADAGPCTGERGAYSISLGGQGCGDLNASAPECVVQSACGITFVSNSPGGVNGLNGTASLGADGSFTGAAITEGTGNRTGCTGTWNAATSTITVDCGGVGSSQSCRATLTRTAMTCN